MQRRLLQRYGFQVVAADQEANLRIQSVPGLNRAGMPDELEPRDVAEIKALKAELLALTGGLAGSGGRVPRDESVALEAILGRLGEPRAFAELALIRWRDDRAEVRGLLEEAAMLLNRDRLSYLIGKADQADDPIRYVRKSLCQALTLARREFSRSAKNGAQLGAVMGYGVGGRENPPAGPGRQTCPGGGSQRTCALGSFVDRRDPPCQP